MANVSEDSMRRRWRGITRDRIEDGLNYRERRVGRREYDSDEGTDLGSWSGASGDRGGEYSAAGAVASAGADGGGSEICATDFLCALDLHRDCGRDLRGALFWVCRGTGGSEPVGAFLERSDGGVLVAANWAAGLLLRLRGAAGESRTRPALSGVAGFAGGDSRDSRGEG